MKANYNVQCDKTCESHKIANSGKQIAENVDPENRCPDENMFRQKFVRQMLSKKRVQNEIDGSQHESEWVPVQEVCRSDQISHMLFSGQLPVRLRARDGNK